MMKNRASMAAIIFLAVVLGAGCSDWRGAGFRAQRARDAATQARACAQTAYVHADVGAGRGELSVALADEVAPRGRVFSTDIDTRALEQIRARVAAAALQNVTVVQARARDTGLPTHYCNAVVLRRVYHHLTGPEATNLDLLRALRPGGVLAIIDFPPLFSWLWPWSPKDTPGNRTGHGVAASLVVQEVTAGGFTLMRVIEDWPGRGPLKSCCAIFRKPEASP